MHDIRVCPHIRQHCESTCPNMVSFVSGVQLVFFCSKYKRNCLCVDCGSWPVYSPILHAEFPLSNDIPFKPTIQAIKLESPIIQTINLSPFPPSTFSETSHTHLPIPFAQTNLFTWFWLHSKHIVFPGFERVFYCLM